MDYQIQHIRSLKTARYAKYGDSSSAKYFWFVLHGSHMVCEQMIRKFSEFKSSEHFVVAPEGLHRFYKEGFAGEVLASWMTSRDRIKEIEDLSQYLSQLYHRYILELPSDCKKIVLGFSQGGTSAYRWLHSENIDLDVLIGYSCWIPEDIDLRCSSTDLSNTMQIYTYGKKDPYLKPDRVEALQEIIRMNHLDIRFEPYNGDHRVARGQLDVLFQKYICQ